MRLVPIQPCPGPPRTLPRVARRTRPHVAGPHQSALRERRRGDRRRAAAAGREQKLVFTDRVLVPLVHLRLGLPHAALPELFQVDRSTVSGAIRGVRPLLGARSFAVLDRPGLRLRRLRTVEDLFAHADAEGVDLRIDGTEVQVRRPRAGRPSRKAVSTTRPPCAPTGSPSSCIKYPKVKAEVEERYRGLCRDPPRHRRAGLRSVRPAGDLP
ncbi:transposase family protein [Streptomyces inhibens]|uniref:transposase family protein n=1 Tax=Streptomyces inhibens TaxID=2293571 RepID=UPI003791AFC4